MRIAMKVAAALAVLVFGGQAVARTPATITDCCSIPSSYVADYDSLVFAAESQFLKMSTLEAQRRQFGESMYGSQKSVVAAGRIVYADVLAGVGVADEGVSFDADAENSRSATSFAMQVENWLLWTGGQQDENENFLMQMMTEMSFDITEHDVLIYHQGELPSFSGKPFNCDALIELLKVRGAVNLQYRLLQRLRELLAAGTCSDNLSPPVGVGVVAGRYGIGEHRLEGWCGFVQTHAGGCDRRYDDRQYDDVHYAVVSNAEPGPLAKAGDHAALAGGVHWGTEADRLLAYVDAHYGGDKAAEWSAGRGGGLRYQ